MGFVTEAVSRVGAHQRELLVQSRCPHCAEHVSRKTVLQGAACPHCDQAAEVRVGSDATCVVEELSRRWKRIRWFAYGALAVAGLLAGLVPLLAALVRFVGLVVLHLLLVRRSMRWLSLGRRVCLKLTLKLYLAVLAALGLVIDVLVTPMMSLSAPIAALVTLGLSVLYAEVALRLIRGRLQREAAGEGLRWSEWALPAVLLATTFVVSAGLVGAVWLTYHLVVEAAIPGVSGLVQALLGGGGSP